MLELISNLRSHKKLAALRSKLHRGLPPALEECLGWLAARKCDDATLALAERIEAKRNWVAELPAEGMQILYSPLPGSAGQIAHKDLRPEHGKRMNFDPERIANTGKDKRWGIFLHLLAREAGSTRALELGTCCGMSAAYIGTALHNGSMTTIEGSQDLANIANSVLADFAHDCGFEVKNALFNEALDDICRENAKFDFAYIDGHHESRATIHYMERILPILTDKAVVVFDDISWSADMREGWQEICDSGVFTDCVDCSVVGVCFYDKGKPAGKSNIWDMSEIVGKVRVGNPAGWQMETAQPGGES